MKRALSFFLPGVLFSWGLVLSGMTQPSKVVSFLDFGGEWDPSLAFVIGGAILVHAISYRFVAGRNSPLLAPSFQLPTRQDIDLQLIVGAGLFGLGWGLAGYCPGPAISSAVVGEPATLIFVGSLTITMILYSLITGRVGGIANRRSQDHELGRPHVVSIGRPAESEP